MFGQQRLRGADVARGFFPADVLLASLQRQPQGRAAIGIFGGADQPSGHLAFVSVARGKVSRVRSAIAHGDAKALRAAHSDVGAELSGGRAAG